MRFLETIKAEHGRLFHLTYHQRRLERTLNAFKIEKQYDLASLLKPPSEGLIRCRVLYDEETITVDYIPYTPRTVNALQAVIDDEIDYSFKYADRSALDADFEARGDCGDIVIVKNGLLTDTTIANIALYDGKRWVTPKEPLLFGTTRERLLEEGKIEEADIPLSELDRYNRCAVMNAMVGFVEIDNGIIRPK